MRKSFLICPLPCRNLVETGVLWDTKAEVQCRRWRPPHPQCREDWGSGVPKTNICWWSCSCVGAVDRGRSFGRGGVPLQRGRLSKLSPWPWQWGMARRNPLSCSPITALGSFTCICFHSYSGWTFLTLAATYVLFQINITVTCYIIICITIASVFPGDFVSPSFFAVDT